MSYQVLTFITTNQSENPLYFSHAEQAAQRYHTIWRLLMANIAVKIENLVKRYGEVIAVDHLNLTIREGEIFGLLGPNGCGKTTTINCLLSLLSYDKGDIEIFGEEITPTNYKLKSQIGVVMQNVAVFDELTVSENIDYFCGLYIRDKALRKQYVEEAIAFVGLEHFRKFYPKKLSGGLLRRLNIACGIAHKPKLIILDEPTAALDPIAEAGIYENFDSLVGEKTAVYISHRMSSCKFCDRIVVLDHGKIAEEGTHESLMERHGIYAKLYQTQAEYYVTAQTGA